MENKEFLQVNLVCPYLPYKLKIIDGWGNRRTMRASHLDDEGNSGLLFMFKPILRTLDSLNSEQLERLGRLIDDKTTQSTNFFFIKKGECFLNGNCAFLIPLPKMTRIMEYLYSIHADVYGLIDKGLAVDIKTIKE